MEDSADKPTDVSHSPEKLAEFDASMNRIMQELDEMMGPQSMDEAVAELRGKHKITRTPIFEERKIVNMAFGQDRNSATLKDVLPGDYEIVLSPEGEAEYRDDKRTLTIPSDDVEFPDTQNLKLLHEAAHAVQSAENRDKDQKTRASLIAQNIGISLALGYLEDADVSENDLTGAQDYINVTLEGYKPEVLSRAKERVARIFEHARGTDSKEELRKYIDEQKTRARKLDTKYRVEIEKDAWVRAINALMELRKKGVNLVEWDNETILNCISKLLETYAIKHEKWTTDKYKFLPFDHTDLQPNEDTPTTT